MLVFLLAPGTLLRLLTAQGTCLTAEIGQALLQWLRGARAPRPRTADTSSIGTPFHEPPAFLAFEDEDTLSETTETIIAREPATQRRENGTR